MLSLIAYYAGAAVGSKAKFADLQFSPKAPKQTTPEEDEQTLRGIAASFKKAKQKKEKPKET